MRHCKGRIGLTIVLMGIFIICVIALPTSIWWIILGVILIIIGLSLLKHEK